MKLVYVLVLGVIVLAFVLQYDWLFMIAFAFLLVVAALNYRRAPSVPREMTKPFQAAPPYAIGPTAPKKKKKIRRPIIIIQQPPRTEGVKNEIIAETMKHAFPPFMTPQHKLLRDKEQHDKDEMMRLLKEQNKQIKELKEELGDVPGYRRKHRYGEDEDY